MEPKKILVVEDDHYINEGIVGFLESEGFQVSAAVNGKEALEMLHASSRLPDAILLDLKMPIMDGLGFCEAQKKDPRVAEIPVILMTANAHAEAVSTKLEIMALVKKPIDIEALSELLKHI